MNTTAEIANSSSDNTFQSFAEVQETQAQKKTCVGKALLPCKHFCFVCLSENYPFCRRDFIRCRSNPLMVTQWAFPRYLWIKGMSSLMCSVLAQHVSSLPRERSNIYDILWALHCCSHCYMLQPLSIFFAAGEITGALETVSTESSIDTQRGQHQASAQNLILRFKRVEVPSLPAWDCMCSRRLL